MRSLLLFLLLAGSSTLFAGEFAILASGARLYVDRHEADAAKVRLYHGTGLVELDASAVKGFEPDDAAPPATAPAPVAAPAQVVPAVAAVASPRELADLAADKYGLPRTLVRGVMAAESGFQQGAVSRKGAIGLMQLMPETARDLGVDPNDPTQNVDGGARYLRDLLLKYDGGLRHALAAYNAGPGAVNKYNGVPPYAETVNYIGRIERKLKQEEAEAGR
ncbi:MAG TPA: lytic transglycosylase domain-containing protein [Candidatus Acidoferrales bacterium]|nr:lytic transglycosylase domain-containing protein [Candidatus Acidoferrales bacterium]